MRRMRELIRLVTEAHPDDEFFRDLELTLKQSQQARSFYRAYDRAFSSLDKSSWELLVNKAISHFKDHRTGQLKQGFFNQLNDAFAYEFLVRRGCSSVSVLREGPKSTPDLEYFIGNNRHCCEVKTIGISQDEIARLKSEDVFDSFVYSELSKGFLEKLDDVLLRAQQQISAQHTTGLVFVVVQFDDFTGQYYERYIKQLNEFLLKHDVPNAYIKIGLIGSRHIAKGTFSDALAGS